jgi:hypothetical protein
LSRQGPASALLDVGSTTSLELTLDRNETAQGPVGFAVDGLPDGVTARFEPSLLDGAENQTTLHLEAAADPLTGLTVVTVRAQGGGELAAEMTFELEVRLPPTLALHGAESALVHPGSSSSVELTLVRNETAGGQVALTVVGLPDGVTAQFEPAVLGDMETQSTLHFEAARDAAEGTFSLTIRAEGPASLIAEHANTFEVQTLTVVGRVSSMLFDLPPEPVEVQLDGQMMMTDADGSFSFEGVRLPYDLIIRSRQITEHFLGLTAVEPRITGINLMPLTGPTERIVITGTITPAPGPGEMVVVCANSNPDILVDRYCDSVTAGDDTSFTLNATLFGSTSTTVGVYARRGFIDGATLSGFSGAAEHEVVITDALAAPVELLIVPSTSTQVSVELASPVSGVITFTSFGDQLLLQQMMEGGSVHVPENGSVYAVAIDLDPDTYSQRMAMFPVFDAPVVPIEFSVPVTLISPDESAPLSLETPFVTDVTTGVVSQVFELDLNSDHHSYVVHSTRDGFTLAEIGADFPPSAISYWGAFHDEGATGVDALVGTEGSSLLRYLALSNGVANAPGPRETLTVSETRELNRPVRALSRSSRSPAPPARRLLDVGLIQ